MHPIRGKILEKSADPPAADRTSNGMNEDDAPWEYKHDGQTAVADKPLPASNRGPTDNTEPPDSGSISWTASEYVDHNRGFSWYATLMLLTVAITVAVYFITKGIFATVIIPVMGIALGVFAARKPKQLPYELNNSGLKIGEKFY